MQLLIECVDDLQQVANPNPNPDPNPDPNPNPKYNPNSTLTLTPAGIEDGAAVVEYDGEWARGAMAGAGRLALRSGETYEGEL